ncbi:MAG: hypothetical protein COB66_07465 [Coxiella sp. (in: Bacteria)]|nr:MAG: hypothetical protein COB66_07465 [Coxiella sp. (in: g-proteobacteria)]
MRKLVYTLLTLAVIIVAALLVSPYFVGSAVQSQFQNQITALNKKSPYVTITADNYKRHWFESTADVNVNFHTPTGLGLPASFNKNMTFNAIVKNGPVFKTAGGFHTGKGALVIEGTTPQFKGSMSAIIKWNNKLDLEANIPTLTFTDSSQDKFTLTGITATTTHGSGNNMVHTVTLEKLNITTPKDQVMNVNDVKISADGATDQNLWLGTGSFSIDSITAGQEMNGKTMAMGNLKNMTLRFNATTTDNGAKFNSDIALNIESVEAMGKTVKPITLSYGINGVNIKSYNGLAGTLKKMQDNGSLQHPSAAQTVALAQGLAGIIEPGFQVKLNKLYVGLPKSIASSPISAQAQVTLKPIDNLLQKIMGSATSAAAQRESTHSTRDAVISGLTHTQAQAGSANAQNAQQMQMRLMQSLPMITGSLMKALNADGNASVPQNLLMQALTGHYTGILSKVAARGTPVSQTAPQLAKEAYDYLVSNKMMIPNSDGSVKSAFTFKDGKLLINGATPALKLPMPGTRSPATSGTTSQPAHPSAAAPSHQAAP